jgi:hypothetical protein
MERVEEFAKVGKYIMGIGKIYKMMSNIEYFEYIIFQNSKINLYLKSYKNLSQRKPPKCNKKKAAIRL